MLQPPEFYLDKLKAHIERHKAYWGWYEIEPLKIEVGFWEEGSKDDLKGVDINQWNALARELNI